MSRDIFAARRALVGRWYAWRAAALRFGRRELAQRCWQRAYTLGRPLRCGYIPNEEREPYTRRVGAGNRARRRAQQLGIQVNRCAHIGDGGCQPRIAKVEG